MGQYFSILEGIQGIPYPDFKDNNLYGKGLHTESRYCFPVNPIFIAVMLRHPLRSSNIISVGWEKGILEIEFHNRCIYQYEVPKETFENMMRYDTPGVYFRHVIYNNPKIRVRQIK